MTDTAILVISICVAFIVIIFMACSFVKYCAEQTQAEKMEKEINYQLTYYGLRMSYYRFANYAVIEKTDNSPKQKPTPPPRAKRRKAGER